MLLFPIKREVPVLVKVIWIENSTLSREILGSEPSTHFWFSESVPQLPTLFLFLRFPSTTLLICGSGPSELNSQIGAWTLLSCFGVLFRCEPESWTGIPRSSIFYPLCVASCFSWIMDAHLLSYLFKSWTAHQGLCYQSQRWWELRPSSQPFGTVTCSPSDKRCQDAGGRSTQGTGRAEHHLWRCQDPINLMKHICFFFWPINSLELKILKVFCVVETKIFWLGVCILGVMLRTHQAELVQRPVRVLHFHIVE